MTFAFPIAIFTVGSILELLAEESKALIGQRLISLSFLFVYTLMALALLLGQVRYWKLH